jgi:hypothetical protein
MTKFAHRLLVSIHPKRRYPHPTCIPVVAVHSAAKPQANTQKRSGQTHTVADKPLASKAHVGLQLDAN